MVASMALQKGRELQQKGAFFSFEKREHRWRTEVFIKEKKGKEGEKGNERKMKRD